MFLINHPLRTQHSHACHVLIDLCHLHFQLYYSEYCLLKILSYIMVKQSHQSAESKCHLAVAFIHLPLGGLTECFIYIPSGMKLITTPISMSIKGLLVSKRLYIRHKHSICSLIQHTIIELFLYLCVGPSHFPHWS